jgi:hypothetical protein
MSEAPTVPAAPAVPTNRPTTPERIGATALFLVLLLAAFGLAVVVLVFLVPKFEQMFKEMDLGELPRVTIILLALANTLRNYWYLAIPAVCGLASVFFTVFFTWGCQTRRRMWSFVALVVVAGGMLVTLAAFGLFMPMVDIMEKIGK